MYSPRQEHRFAMEGPRYLAREMDSHISLLKIRHGVQFEDEALLLTARIALHLRINKPLIWLSDRFMNILIEAVSRIRDGRYSSNDQNRLDKYKYNLRRALVEYQQLVKEQTEHCIKYFWLWQVKKELRDAFVDLVTFMKMRMQVSYDDFVSCVHDAERINDYARILDQLDAKIHCKFKEKLVVGVHEIAEIGSDLTGIPSSWLSANPEERYKRVQERLKKRVIGRDDIIDATVEALMKPKAGSRWSGRPLGFFLFAGPEGVGKAELAKAIASELYDDGDGLIQIDMEKYNKLDSVLSFVGPLAALVKNKPYSVVLLDRIEKAHSFVMDILIKILITNCDEPKNRKGDGAVDFRNTLVIMTLDVEDEHVYELMLAAIFKRSNQVVSKYFKPQLLNSVDKMVVFDRACTLEDTARLMLREWGCVETKRRKNRTVIACPSTSALIKIASNAWTMYGKNSKGLKRWLDQRVVFPMMSKMIVEDDGVSDMVVYIDTIEEIGELSFQVKRN